MLARLHLTLRLSDLVTCGVCAGVREALQTEPDCKQECSQAPKGEVQERAELWASTSPVSSRHA